MMLSCSGKPSRAPTLTRSGNGKTPGCRSKPLPPRTLTAPSSSWDGNGASSTTTPCRLSATQGKKSDWADYVSVTYPTLEAADPTPTPIPDICLIVATHNSATLRLQAGTLSEFIGRFGETPADFTIHTARFFAGRNRSAMETPLQAPEALLPADPVPVPVGLT